MKTVRDACQLQPNALSVKLSDQIEQLRELIGSVADIATRAFANLLTAAGKKKNVCIVASDLAAAYDMGGKLINKALQDARAELGRQERTITPVDLAANEIYDILRKRLFSSLPDKTEIEDIADEIVATYPSHPRLKNVVALFKENEQFKQIFQAFAGSNCFSTLSRSHHVLGRCELIRSWPIRHTRAQRVLASLGFRLGEKANWL